MPEDNWHLFLVGFEVLLVVMGFTTTKTENCLLIFLDKNIHLLLLFFGVILKHSGCSM